MKKVIAAVAIVGFGFAGSASAADMPTKAPAYKAPVAVAPSWTGFYIGAGGGRGMYDLDTQLVSTVTGAPVNVSLDQGGRGWLATAQIGYDYQFGGNWLIGAFVDGDWSRIRGSHTGESGNVGLIAGDMTLNRSWAVGGKFGYLVNPSLMSFVSGGFTQAHFNGTTYANLAGTPDGFAVPAQNYNGYFIGSGAEYAIAMVPGLFWKTEYRFADYRAQTLNVFNTATGLPTGIGELTHPYVQTVRSELVWRFGGGSPAAAAAMPVKALPPTNNWTGFYIGAGGGRGMYDLDTQLVSTVTGAPVNVSLDQGGRGWLATAQIGYDYQFGGNWLIGAFVDGDWSRIRGSHTGESGNVGLIAGDMTLNRSWAVGGKFGYLVNPSLMSFVSGGFTQAHFNGTTYANLAGTPDGFAVPAQNYNGYFIGSGGNMPLPWCPDCSGRLNTASPTIAPKHSMCLTRQPGYPPA